jgi:sulfate transport system ATP-binding protein
MGVDLRDITCLFGRTPAVRDISLVVPTGEFLALVGPSGAGKTTLLRIIAGLQPGYTGHLTIGTRDVTQVPARDRNIGFVFQNYALFRHMTVADNVAFGLQVRPRARRPDRHAIAARVTELLELVQVGALAKRYPAQLSGGQRQRVALARALATEPELLLLDEPFGALDPLVRKEIRGWLRGLHDRLGLTSILVTHDQEEALEVADRIAVLRDGRLEQVGTPHDLEDAPATPFVHQFLGETVTFPAIRDHGRLRLDGAWAHVATTLPGDSDAGGGSVLLSLRPYEIGLSACAAGETGAHIVAVQRAGAFTRYRLAPTTDGQADTLEILVPAILPPLPSGTRCRLDLSRARLFGTAAQQVSAPGMVATVPA